MWIGNKIKQKLMLIAAKLITIMSMILIGFQNK